MIAAWIFEQVNISSDEDPSYFDAKHCSDEYAWRLESWTRAEDLGFRGIFFSEHHFNGIRACPSPNLLAAAVAARTKTLRIGVLGMVLPLWQPWRAAEEIGMLDQLSGGRAEIGVARGTNSAEAEAVGIPAAEIGPRYEEALDVLDKALAEPPFSHHGRFWSTDGMTILPRPVQNPMPAPWATVRSAESAAAAARRGYRACTGFLNPAMAKEVFDTYRAAAAEQGHPADPARLALRRSIFVARSARQAAEYAEISRLMMPSLSPQDVIAGTPKDVAEQVVEQLRHVGAANMVGFFAGHWTDRAAVDESYRLFGHEVVPTLNRA